MKPPISESAYMGKPDPEMPLFAQVSAAADEQASPKGLIDNALASHELGSRRNEFACTSDEAQGHTSRIVAGVTGADGGSMPPSRTLAGISAPDKSHARRTDPATSHKAAASVTNLGRTKDRILSILRTQGPMTDEQIGAYFERFVDFKVSPSGLRTRRSWLVDHGFVEACFRRHIAGGPCLFCGEMLPPGGTDVMATNASGRNGWFRLELLDLDEGPLEAA